MDVIQYTVQYPTCWSLGQMLHSVLKTELAVKFVHISRRG